MTKINTIYLTVRTLPKDRPRRTTKVTDDSRTYTSRSYTGHKYRNWKTATYQAAMAARVAPKTVKVPLVLGIVSNFDKYSAADVDNLAGGIMDALGETKKGMGNGVIYDDDRDVVGLIQIKLNKKTDPHAVGVALYRMADKIMNDLLANERGDNTTIYYWEVQNAVKPA